MSTVYLVQHAEKQRRGGDPGLTVTGRAQALWTGMCLRGRGITEVWASPLRRARETAEIIAAALGLPVKTDARLRERMNWDGSQPVTIFQDEFAHTTADRDYQPMFGDSSRTAGDRLAGFLADHADPRRKIVVVSHGGVTVDLLRTLYGDGVLADRPVLLGSAGVPACAITTMASTDDGWVLQQLADDSHLRTAEIPLGAFVHQLGGYRPRWLYSAREILDVHGAELAKLVGTVLQHTWLLWDLDLDEWYAEGPIQLEFGDTRLTVCHQNTGECSLTWHDLDPNEPADAGDESLRLTWRADQTPALAGLQGARLRGIDLIEVGDHEGRWIIECVEFVFDDRPPLRLANHDGRNALAHNDSEPPQRRRVHVN